MITKKYYNYLKHKQGRDKITSLILKINITDLFMMTTILVCYNKI